MNEYLCSLAKEMQTILKPSRYEHTMGVAYTAANLAMRYEENMEDAFVAGLLHDNAKYLDGQDMIRLCEDNQIPLSETERKNPYLLHAKAGAILAKTKYHIEKEGICSAITYHTTGRPDMSVLEKIIFVADYIEPNRTIIPNLNLIRKNAYLNLDETVYQILYNTLLYLKETKDEADIDTMTINSYNYYKKIVE